MRAELLNVIANRDKTPKNPNAVYNATVILGTWVRILPPGLAEEKRAIDRDLKALQKSLAGNPEWRNTARVLTELLEAANPDTQRDRLTGGAITVVEAAALHLRKSLARRPFEAHAPPPLTKPIAA